MHRFRDEVKLYKVIDSCKTVDQCEAAFKYIEAYINYYCAYMADARIALRVRQQTIEKKQELQNATN